MNDRLISEDSSSLTALRDNRLTLELFEYAAEYSINCIRSRRKLLAFSSIAVFISTILALWILKNSTMYLYISYLTTLLAGLLVVLTIWGYIAKWDQQIETKVQLSHNIQKAILLVKNAERTLQQDQIEDCISSYENIVSQRKYETNQVSSRAMQLAYQHIASKYIDLGLVCSKCDRIWLSRYSLQRAIWMRIPGAVCPACGIRLKGKV